MQVLETKQKTALNERFELSGRGERIGLHNTLCVLAVPHSLALKLRFTRFRLLIVESDNCVAMYQIQFSQRSQN